MAKAGHPLAFYPRRQVTGRVRLPLIQHPGESVADNLKLTLSDRDNAMRRIKTTGQHKHIGPLAPLQAFTQDAAGGSQSEANMLEGLRLANARRISNKARGQSAGL